MEIQVARRRINMIASHFAPTDDISVTNVLPMNCSSCLNSVIRRCDNRMSFARQGSVSQANFMRQATIEENCSGNLNSVIRRCDNRMLFARQGSVSQANFMRQATIEEVNSAQSGLPLKPYGYKGSYNYSEAPLFSRPVMKEPDWANVAEPMVTVPEPSEFARPSRRISGGKKLHSKKKIHSSESNGIEWSPRMDVAESGHNYVMTVEIPGVNRHDIRVEVDDQKLTVTGRRSTQYWKVADRSNDSISTHHKREILQGPYQAVWPLPAHVNKDNVTAEFL
ncbi:Small heat shock protein C2 [Fagus crenata]